MQPNGEAVVPVSVSQTPPRLNVLDTVAFWLLASLMVIVPLGFLPSSSVPLATSKAFFALALTILTVGVFLIARLREGVLPIPTNAVFGALVLIPLTALISALFASPHFNLSFFGARLEAETVMFLLLMALLTVAIPLLVRTRQRILSLYTVLLSVFAVLALFQGLRLLVGPSFLSMGVFTTSTLNLLGKWNDIGVFFGLTAMLSMLTLEGLRLKSLIQVVLYGTLAIALFFVALVNFTPVWVTLGLFSLGFVIYSFFRRMFTKAGVGDAVLKRSRISVLALILLLVSALFSFTGETLGNALSVALDVSSLEVRPSWQGTADVLKSTYRESALLGSGPNTFSLQWVSGRPLAVNETIFWNVDFPAGIGNVPTLFITTGLLGALAWLLFFALFLYGGFRALLKSTVEDGFAYYLVLTSFLAAVYLFVFQVVYVPSTALTVLAFVMAGICFAALRHTDALKERRLVFSEAPKLGFVAVLSISLVLILLSAALYQGGVRYAATYYFQSSVDEVNTTGNLDAAEARATRALQFVDLDIYHQLLTEIGMLRLNQIVNSTEGTVEDRRARFQSELGKTIGHAQRATELRPDNFQNWLTLGRVYQAVVPLQIQGAYENARQSFERAQALAEHQPQVYLSLAELEAVNQDYVAAKAHLERALEEKRNYTAAVFLLAQIQLNEGDVRSAIESVEAATVLDPQNPVVFFQLGFLYYNQGDNAKAASALEQAVLLNEPYSNARYFLGLTYAREKRAADAIAQFERVLALNPGNQEVMLILENLKAGREPFTNAPLGTEAPEDRESPPIDGE
jgi:cytochrome c-type biogenesis protein CcmH/NrfG